MHSTTLTTAAWALALVGMTTAKPCTFNEQDPFFLSTIHKGIVSPLYVARYDTESRNNDNYGLSTHPPPKSRHPSVFNISGGNLLATGTSYPRYEPFETTEVVSGGPLHLVQIFQDPPEDVALSLIVDPRDAGACVLAFEGDAKHWFTCGIDYADDPYGFLGYVDTKKTPKGCEHVKVVAYASATPAMS